MFTVLFFQNDYTSASETFLVDYFIISIVFKKISEFLLKVISTIPVKFSHNLKLLQNIDFNDFYFPVTVAIHRNIHRTMANNLGLSIPCICSAIQRTTFSHVIPPSGYQFNTLNTINSIFGQRHIPHIIRTTNQILGT